MTEIGFRVDLIWSISSWVLAGIVLLQVIIPGTLFAVNPKLSISQYLHTSWTQEEGSALPPIQALAQTADGYLWLGTGNGLIRFDGMRFVEWSLTSGPALPSSNISCLRAAPGGGLWVGTAAGVCRVDHGRVVRYPAVDKLPCGLILSMLEDRLGRLWILNGCQGGNTLALLQPNGTWQTFGVTDGLPDQWPTALFQDRQGRLWVGTANASACQWSPGTDAVCSKGPAFDVVSIAEGGDGQLVMASGIRNQGFRFSNGEAKPFGPRVPDSTFMREAMVCDRDGNVWIGTTGQGLLRLRENRVERFTRSDGLSSNSVQQPDGRSRGRPLGGDRARRRPDSRSQGPALLDAEWLIRRSDHQRCTAAKDGAVWIGTTGGGLNRLAGEASDSILHRTGSCQRRSAFLVRRRDRASLGGHQHWAGGAVRRSVC